MTEEKEPQKIRSFSELMGQIQILDGLMANAVRNKDFNAALRIQGEADKMLARLRRMFR